MAIKYSQGQGDDLAPLNSVGIDDDGATGWWSGAQKCFAGVAFASVLAATTLSTSLAAQIQQGDQSDVPAGSLVNLTVEESYWQNQTRPVPASFYQALPYFYDPAEIVPQPAAFQPDEDSWQSGVPPVQSAVFRSPIPLDPDDIPAGSLFGQQDEDFWRNPVAPVPASNLWPQQWAFDVQESAGSLFGQYDEDFWRSGVAPVWWTNLSPQQASFDVQEPALFGQPDEDYWRNSVAPVVAGLYRSPLLGDQEEIPAGTLLAGEPDEDLWINPVRPQPATLYQSLPYLFESADFVPAIAPQIDEDIWRNPVAPVTASLYQRLPLGDVEELPAGRFFGQYDEDFWTNPVFPVPARNYVALPLGDPEELPSGSLSGQPDEDYWQNPVPPVAASLYRSPLFRDPEEVPGSLLKSPSVEELYWQNAVWPVPGSLYQRLPYSFDSGELNGPAQSGTALPAGLSLVAAENDPVASILVAQAPGGSLPARRRGRAYPSAAAPKPLPESSAVARPSGLSVRVGQGKASAIGAATARADAVRTLHVAVGKITAKGIRNPTDEELIAILLGA